MTKAVLPRVASALPAMLLLIAGVPTAHACTVHRPVDLGQAYAADLILEGQVADYTVTGFDSAVLRLVDVDGIKGQVSGAVEIAVVSDGPIVKVTPGTKMIVGVMQASSQPPHLAEWSKGLPLVHAPLCTNAFIVPSTQENRAEIEAGMRSNAL